MYVLFLLGLIIVKKKKNLIGVVVMEIYKFVIFINFLYVCVDFIVFFCLILYIFFNLYSFKFF